MEETRILGEEKISKLLFKFAIPCISGLLIGAFYNIVDQIFIGNSSLGYLGNAATGISFPVICIANAFAWCVGDGAAAFLSICAGRKDSESAHKSVGTGLTVSFIVSIVLTIVCLIFQKPLMVIFGASDMTLTLALDYFRIMALFFPFYLLFNVMNSMIRADGSPAYAMVGMGAGALLNIILDPIFIFILDWGIKGAAYASVIGQVVSFVICALYFLKPKTFHLKKESFKVDFQILRNILSFGGSTFIIQIGVVITTVLSNMILFHYGSLSIYGSDIPISVFSIQVKVYTIVNNIVVGIALGGQPILGYNYGAGKLDRVKETYKRILTWSMAVGVIATAVFQFCPQVVIRMFGTGNALYQDFAVKTFRIYLALCIVTALIKMTGIFFQSIGKPIQAMVTSIIRDIICFAPLTIFLSYFLETRKHGIGIYGILFAAPISDLIAGVIVVALTVIFFRKLNDREESVEDDQIIQPSKAGVIITIAREHGSQGKQIGKLVAEKLGIPFYYKEMTALAAQESGLAKEFVSDINKNSKALHQLYLSSNVIQQAVIAQEKIIRKIADNGSCVIVGRAADYVLRDYDNVVNLFMYAPTDKRIENVMEMYGDTYEEAKANLAHSDEARSSYYRNISGKEWRATKNYNMCIDTSIGKEDTAELIVQYIKGLK